MDTILDRAWTTESFLAWEDQQEGKHEFDGCRIVPMTGGTIAHQTIVLNLGLLLRNLLVGQGWRVLHEMRLRIGDRVRYPDVVICAASLDETTRTLTDAVAIVEVLSDDTAKTDRVAKLIEYGQIPSLASYVLVEQSAVAATVFRRTPDRRWEATPHVSGTLRLPGLDIVLTLADVYHGLSFAN